MSAKEDSNYRWKSILGNFIDDSFLRDKHGPCPLCGGKDRFRFEPESERGSYICSHCGAGTGIHLLSQFLNVNHAEAWKKVENVIGTAIVFAKKQEEKDRSKFILELLKRSHVALRNENVMQYLQNRGITKPSPLLLASDTGPGTSLMIARFAKSSKLQGLHVTYIRDGQKDSTVEVQKRMYAKNKGSLIGSAIYLHELQGRNKIILAEGIETALSASELFGLPAWATGSAGLLEAVDLPDRITDVMICGDNDESFTGHASAYILAKRLKDQKKNVKVVFPDMVGKDWNDVLQETKGQAVSG